MPSHHWGDEWFKLHGTDLDDAIDYCKKTWKRYGRIGSHGKEKYGTFRDHPVFYSGYWAVHELVKPGYIRYTWPRFYKIDLFLGKVVGTLKLYKLIQWWQFQVYNYAVQQACKKYPEIVDEIVADLDGYELVKPSIFGKIDGKKIHNKYWTTIN